MYDIKAFLFDDDRGVSPVIGVILMVAITVILAAVIASFVLGLGDTSSPTPQTSFDFDYDETGGSNGGGSLEVTVGSGDTFEASQAAVSIGGDSTQLTDLSSSSFAETSVISAGTSFTLESGNGGAVAPGTRVDITFTPEEGGESTILGTFTAPEN